MAPWLLLVGKETVENALVGRWRMLRDYGSKEKMV